MAFDSSATLAEQVAQGAPADVLATADEDTMKTVVDAGDTARSPQLFATNHLVMVVPTDNPAGITQFSDLDKQGRQVRRLRRRPRPAASCAVKVLANDRHHAPSRSARRSTSRRC